MSKLIVAIDVRPFLGPGMDEDFADELRAALHKRKAEFIYKEVAFRMEYNGNNPKGVKIVLDDLDAPLPSVFEHELTVGNVTLRSSVPSRLPAATGWYDGNRFGFPHAGCCVDLKGEHPHHLGKGQLFAVGDSHAHVVGLFRKVLTGKLRPGNATNRWAGMPPHDS